MGRGTGRRGTGALGLRSPPLPFPSVRFRRKKLTDIWKELKSEREKRQLLEVGLARIPRLAGRGHEAGPSLTPSLH